ncbi:MAG: 50S ribosomal protein L17 [Proteobacteria bacterium]|nr:50S ribosomal protein L17 [Pseudomonadota bacterium]
MRHRNAKNKLGRTSAHYAATVSNMLSALFRHGRLQTTEGKARELRRVAERTVTKAVRLGDILTRDWKTLGATERAQLVHALRMVKRTVRDREATLLMFREWAPRYLGRSGGYTAMFKLGKRRGDNAPMALLELVPAEKPESA